MRNNLDGSFNATSLTYDGDGLLQNRSQWTQGSSNAWQTIATYTYDNASRIDGQTLQATASTNASVFTYGYDDDGRLTSTNETRGTGYAVLTSYGYDGAGNVTNISYKGISTPGVVRTLSSQTIGYDNAGHRTSITGSSMAFTYDNKYQVDGQTRTDDPGWYEMSLDDWSGLEVDTNENWDELKLETAIYNIGTTFDDFGRCLSETVDGVTTTYTHSGARVTGSTTSGGSGGGGTTTLTYDSSGRREICHKATGTTTYTWDAEGRLANAEIPDGQSTHLVTYTYDGNSLLTSRDSPSGYTGYVWNGRNLAAETDVNENRTAEYNIQLTGYGRSTQRTDLITGTTTGYLFDSSGNVRAVTDSDGNVTADRYYDGFGVLRNSSAEDGATNEDTIGFGGAYGILRDPETGLYYCRARWYDPITKQFLSPDPLGALGSGEENQYSYAGNDGVNAADPDGLDTVFGLGNSVYWGVESPSASGGSVNWGVPGKQTGSQLIGTKSGGSNVLLSPAFGGGLTNMNDLQSAASQVFDQRRDLSGLTRKQQSQAIGQLIQGASGSASPSGEATRNEWVQQALEAAADADQQAKLAAQQAAMEEQQRWIDRLAWQLSVGGKFLYETLGWASSKSGDLEQAAVNAHGQADNSIERAAYAIGGTAAAYSDHAYGALQGVATVLSPADAAYGVYQNYEAYDAVGVGFWTATVLQFNPLVGLAEAFDGVSYQAGDFGQELSGLDRTSRGLISLGSVGLSALGPVGAARSIVGASVTTQLARHSLNQGIRNVGSAGRFAANPARQIRIYKVGAARQQVAMRQLMHNLNRGNAFSQRLAGEIAAGNLRVKFRRLADDYGIYDGGGRVRINTTPGRDRSLIQAVTAVHEGRHFFDDLAGIRIPPFGRLSRAERRMLEHRAFLSEARYAQSIGRRDLSEYGVIMQGLPRGNGVSYRIGAMDNYLIRSRYKI